MFNIGQASDANSFDEARSCSKSDSLANSSPEKNWDQCKINDVCELVNLQDNFN